MSEHLARPEHEAAYQELLALVRRRADEMTSIEVLAVAANMVGKLVAMQDQRSITPEQAMQVVARNIEMGNRQVLEALASAPGGSA